MSLWLETKINIDVVTVPTSHFEVLQAGILLLYLAVLASLLIPSFSLVNATEKNLLVMSKVIPSFSKIY